jgi:hypothetical protein
MENEEQAIEETGETRFKNVFGARTNMCYAFFSLLKQIFHSQLPAIDVVSSTQVFELNSSFCLQHHYINYIRNNILY